MGTQIINRSSDKLASIETRIAGALKPVSPPQEFVQHVRRRIHLTPIPVAVHRLSTTSNHFLWALGGVFTAALIIITGARALFYLLGRTK